jgi:hypothetical protein
MNTLIILLFLKEPTQLHPNKMVSDVSSSTIGTCISWQGSQFTISYPKDIINQAELVIGGGEIDCARFEEFIADFPVSEVEEIILSRNNITDNDKIVSYGLQLIATDKLSEDGDFADLVSLFKKAWYINPQNSDIAQFVGISEYKDYFGEDFVNIVKIYINSYTNE